MRGLEKHGELVYYYTVVYSSVLLNIKNMVS